MADSFQCITKPTTIKKKKESSNNVPEKYLHSMYRYRFVNQYIFLSCIYKILCYIQYLYYLQNTAYKFIQFMIFLWTIMNVTCKLYNVLNG